MGHFVSWPMEGQSSTSRSGWGHHRGPVSTGGGGGLLQQGKMEFLCLFPSKSLSLTDSENTNPNIPPGLASGALAPVSRAALGLIVQ